MAGTRDDSLISTHPSTSGLQIALHPLALLTISDYITRHTLRKQTGPMVGALLGTQEGRDIAIEHAYEIIALVDKDQVRIDEEWFDNKLRLCGFPFSSSWFPRRSTDVGNREKKKSRKPIQHLICSAGLQLLPRLPSPHHCIWYLSIKRC